MATNPPRHISSGVGTSHTGLYCMIKYRNCWIYIYIANMEQLPNPNALEPGMELMIPELTAEEMRINKDQCLKKYYETRNNR